MTEEHFGTKLEEFVRHSRDLGETAIRLAKLRAAEKTAAVSASLVFRVITAGLAFMVFLFGSTAAALWLGDLFGSRATGFLVVGGFYLFMLGVLLLLKKTVILPYLRDRVVRSIYSQN